MNNIKRKIPNKIKSNLLLDGNVSGMFITHAIIQGIILTLLIILFGFTENMHIFSAVTSAMMIVFITHVITFILYKKGNIEFQMKRGADTSTSLTGWVLSPVGVLVQLAFSSIFNVWIFITDDLPGWRTQFEIGFTNITGIIIGLILSTIFVYLFFLKEEDYTTKEYYEKMKEYNDLFPNNTLDNIIQKTDEYFEYGNDCSYDYSREIIPIENNAVNKNSIDLLLHHEEASTEIHQEDKTEIKIKNNNNGKTIRQKR